MNLYRQPVVVETVHEIVATCHASWVRSATASKEGKKFAPRNIIIRSLISGCSTASIILSRTAVSFSPSNRVDDLYREASSCAVWSEEHKYGLTSPSEPLQQRWTKRSR